MPRSGKPRPSPRTPSRGGSRPVARRRVPAKGTAAAKGASPRPRESGRAGVALEEIRPARSESDPVPRTLDADPSGELIPSEEERIESSKYSSAPPKRLFEEERFLFPESYGVNRVRLLVKDPQWLFAYWDIDPKLLAGWRRELGERTMALSRLTLRLYVPGHGDDMLILVPAGARSWYVRAEVTPRAYAAELGLTLPSGEFRSVARSNTVETPRVGPSPEVASRKVPYPLIASELFAPPSRVAPSTPEGRTEGAASATLEGRRPTRKGGASDVFRR
jgi:hypothetical protein